MQVPSNLILNYMGRPSLYLGFFTSAWGLVSLLTSQVKSFGGIVACRFILGLVEAPFFAGVLFYLSKWYTKKELALRMSIFYAGSLLSGAFGSLIAAGILKGLDGKNGLAAWQWLYIIEGAITIAVGIAVMLFLPDFPSTWKRLSEEERHVANRRLAIEAADADVDEAGKMSQIRVSSSPSATSRPTFSPSPTCPSPGPAASRTSSPPSPQHSSTTTLSPSCSSRPPTSSSSSTAWRTPTSPIASATASGFSSTPSPSLSSVSSSS